MIGVHEKTIQALDKKRLEAVIAHEIAHLREDRKAMSLIAALSMFFLIFGVYITCSILAGIFLLFLGLPANGMLLSSVYPWVWAMAYLGSRMLIFTLRQREFCADAYSVMWTGDADALRDALIKTDPSSMRGKGRKFFWHAFSRDDHPEIDDRLVSLERLKIR